MYEGDKNAKISKRKAILPPHLMHCSNFFGRIYVKKTPEQCSLNHYSSQRTKEDVWWDMYLSEGLNGWQVCDQDGQKMRLYKKKESLWGRDQRKVRREERERITVASTLINSEFNNNPSPRIIISSILIFISILDYSGYPD